MKLSEDLEAIKDIFWNQFSITIYIIIGIFSFTYWKFPPPEPRDIYELKHQMKIDSLQREINQLKTEVSYHLTRSDSADAVREVLKERLKLKSKQYEKAYKNIDSWTIDQLDSVLSATNKM